MAHIADFMVDADLPNSVGLNNYIAREVSPAPSYEAAGEKASGENERSTLGSALRSKSKDPKPKEQSLVRRRKVSVPELGPMTTVQEVAMDSPTIPGRPALHERSISAPGNSWKQHMFGESMVSCISEPILDEILELDLLDGSIASSIGATPVWTPDSQRSPKQWASPTPSSSVASPQVSHTRGQSESSHPGHLKKGDKVSGHRRGESETSIMDRGRPKKRPDGSPVKQPTGTTTTRSRTASRSSPTEEQKAFATLPQGIRASNAASVMPMSEIEALRKQAFGQASRFDVLSSKDVDNLSRELRSLDERCEYLTATHRSLRSGRRNLHDRICSFLRSPRVARFSHESILKQEEALSELDSSIDDWVTKLEHAENRRTRVRQKLLEHVAAALILQPSTLTTGEYTPPRSPTKAHSPPRSPVKSQSPQRLAEVVKVSTETFPVRRTTRMSVESIKIYADNDVYALLADVEDEMNRMGGEQIEVAQPEEKLASAAEVTLNSAVYQSLPSTVYEGLPSTVYKRPQIV
ncbi:hypothetical protein M7I_2909 [Glarea lozoyensis 74030]|uniref:Up-regulated during septation protein 1 domain-containing protein n=1 Tax=Glarea lozoyensis (strain ATCC 74030 / MF5533) TaxID=1104152 RepID=H0EK21_GLAL7|nr:hypothetical protein M7I_2909 [Glarea lozoyensis 74030]